MPLLEQAQYDRVIEKGKQAVAAIKNGDVDTFLQKANEGWGEFPEPRSDWNQGYNYAKMVLKHLLDNCRFDEAEIWLNRMIENNNVLQNYDQEPAFYTGKYHFEKGEYADALRAWKAVVKETGFRYFENERQEYLRFYNNPETLLN